MMGAAAAQMAERVLCLPVVGWFLGCSSGGSPSQTALDDIPADYLNLYMQAAATCPGLSWTTLAAIGKVESDHGRSRLPGVVSGTNSAGAAGDMQFLAPTFAEVVARHPLPAGGANPPSRYNRQDAIYAAAFYLCDNHVATDLTGALWTYNHSDIYVAQVVTQATQYSSTSGFAADTAPSDAGYAAVLYAQGQIGLPYLWGGDGPAEGGWDCSGLTRAAYKAAGIDLPRTAQTQYEAGPVVPPGQPLQIGDLVYYGTATNIHHVAIYIGNGQMISAPGQDQLVHVAPYRWPGDDYFGATRPGK
ncbi:hydrolase Nlp/P60 [Frankia sp. B2]|uniref:C40 family peptidase n=1 Tax=unclassified Frankia TaxID=2632575 RepID=UPI0006CA1FE6|nr:MULTISPECIES: C40 family peptidase [unclassified Frankia]KPM53166.1 hydrolase Nlp/P60 [Frankia sp. R43]TFE26533.1 hydrolase Nlp/P60 [Frankia sp. B2]